MKTISEKLKSFQMSIQVLLKLTSDIVLTSQIIYLLNFLIVITKIIVSLDSPTVIKSLNPRQSTGVFSFQSGNITFESIYVIINGLSLFELISDNCI